MSQNNEDAPDFGKADLTNCDREPIHIPGSIQPHGLLVALDPSTRRIAQVGGDARGLVGRDAGALLGEGLDAVLDAPACARVEASVAAPGGPTRPVLAIRARMLDGVDLEVAAHVSGGVPIVEIEPGDGSQGDPLDVVRGAVARLQGTPELEPYLEALAREVRAATGYARVMVYRFAPDDSGEVVAEVRRPELTPFLGLHYPASDIPKQAREMYLRSWIRVIVDARSAAAPLVPQRQPATEQPLDLTFALLRSVSPLHLEYLANMGVRASMSLSLVVEGRLWGMIACHHDAPKRLSHAQRVACELLAQMVSLQIGEKLARGESAERVRMSAVHAQLVEALSRERDLVEALVRGSPTVLDYIRANGAALSIGGRISRIGRTPGDEALTRLVDWLDETMPDGVFATDRLAEHYPEASAFADAASGLVALSVSRAARDYVLWFRNEAVETVTWAGNPSKPVEVSAAGEDRLSPRKSFAAWREQVRGRSLPWAAEDVDAAKTLRASILEVVLRRIDEIAREREAARARQDVLIAELDHRVKNTLATIQSLMKYSAANAESLETFTRTVQMRLHAMARTHDMLTRARWEGAVLASILEAEVAPYGGSNRVKLDGPVVTLKPKPALSIALAVHELATNAAKYGALSVPDGWVEVEWNERPETGSLVLVWRERGGPPVSSPTRRGFGRTLLERSLAYEVGGRVTLDFARDGFVCIAELPLAHLVQEPEGASGGDSPAGGADTSGAVEGKRVLVVEDQALIAMEAQDELERAGIAVVGPCGRLDSGVKAARTETLDAALIDIDLDGERSWPIADALTSRGVPFAFTTGFQAQIVFPERFLSAPVLSKPYPDDALVALVSDLVATTRDTGA